MNMKTGEIILSIGYIILLCFILFCTFVVVTISDIVRHFCGGLLEYVFYSVYALCVMIPIVFRKKFRILQPLPVALIVFALFSVFLNFVIFIGVSEYISDFSIKKWQDNPPLRVHMIDSLEADYAVVGMDKTTVVEILGEPDFSDNIDDDIFEYYIGDSIIDPYTYDIEFENGVVVSTRIREH